MTRKFSAGLTAKTEKMLGEKAGHLELLRVGAKGKGGAKERKRRSVRRRRVEGAKGIGTNSNEMMIAEGSAGLKSTKRWIDRYDTAID